MMLHTKQVLGLWLTSVPEYAVEFTRLALLFVLYDSISGPLTTAINATGKVRSFQLVSSVVLLGNIPIAYVLLYLHFSPYTVLWGNVLIAIVLLGIKCYYLLKYINFPVKDFLIRVVFKTQLVTLLAIPIPYILSFYLHNFWGIVCNSLISTLIIVSLAFSIAFDVEKKAEIRNFVSKKINFKF